MSVPTLGERVPCFGNRLTRALGAAILRLAGWRIEGTVPNVPKMVVIGAPHTTAWDFAAAMTVILALGIRLSWMGAEWVFRFPFMRAIGGIKIERSERRNVVAQTVAHFDSLDRFFLGLSPEGSRSKVVPWKTGFYHIARGAGVPILMVAIDRAARTLEIGPSFVPSGDYASDMETTIRPYYERFVERHPDRFGIG